MGPSGSGKSTLLNLLSGIDRPSAGEVVVAGERLNDLSEDELAHWRARHVGLIFQFFNLMPVLSARDNVALPLLLTRLDKRERRGAPRRRCASSASASGSTTTRARSRAASSSASPSRARIVTDPDLIVADEPTGDLDARNAEEILGLLRQLKNDFGKTVVMVTHDPRALRFVDEAFHLDKGILLEGEAAERAGEAIRRAAGGALGDGCARGEVPRPHPRQPAAATSCARALTGGAIMLAVALVCMLLTMPAGLDALLDSIASNTRISVHNKAGIVYSMPYAFTRKVRQVDGVAAAVA